MADWGTPATVKDVLLFLLAVYGAALSTFNWRQSVRKERRSITVNMSTAMLALSDGSIVPDFLEVKATNNGHRSVTVVTLTIETPAGERLYRMTRDGYPGMVDTPLPVSLSDGQSARLFLAYQDIAAALIRKGHVKKTKITPVCEDSSGGIHRGAPRRIDPPEFSRM